MQPGTPILRNLTPHDCIIYDGDTVIVSVPPSGVVCRVSEQRSEAAGVTVGGSDVPVTVVSAGSVEELPDPEPGVLLFVSRIAAQAITDRPDVVFPLDEVRDEANRIIGCRSLGRFA